MGFESEAASNERSGGSYAEYSPMELRNEIDSLNVTQLSDLRSELEGMQQKLDGTMDKNFDSDLAMPEDGSEATAIRDGGGRTLDDVTKARAQVEAKLEMVKEAIQSKG